MFYYIHIIAQMFEKIKRKIWRFLVFFLSYLFKYYLKIQNLAKTVDFFMLIGYY